MQVSSSLIAAQAAARQAQAQFQAQIRGQQTVPPQAAAAASRPAAAPDATPGATGDFAPLPLKQAQTPAPAAPQGVQTGAPARLGQHIDITV